MNGLAGKVALVTGSASGSGPGWTGCWRTRAPRWPSVTWTVSPQTAVAAGLSGTAPKLSRMRLDVTDRAAADQAVTRVEQDLGPVNVLVNNAGISSVAPFLGITDSRTGTG